MDLSKVDLVVGVEELVGVVVVKQVEEVDILAVE